MFKSLNYFNETGLIFYFEFRNVFTFFPLKFFKIYFLGPSTSGSFLYPASISEPCPLSRVTGLKTYPLSQQPPPPKRSTFSLASNTLLFVFKKALFLFFLILPTEFITVYWYSQCLFFLKTSFRHNGHFPYKTEEYNNFILKRKFLRSREKSKDDT